MKSTDIAYLAGFVDAEGSISVLKRKSSRRSIHVRIEIVNTNKEVIDWICSLLQCNYNIRKPKNAKHRRAYRIFLWDSKAIDVLSLIKDYLIIKKEHCDIALSTNQTNIEESYAKISALNCKGLSYAKFFDSCVVSNDVNKYNTIKNVPNTTDENKAYIAGFVDGDGCITVSKKKCNDGTIGGVSYRLHVILSNRDKDILKWIHNLTGVGYIQEYSRSNKNQAIAYKLTIWSNQASQFVSLIQDFLIIKKQNAKLAIEFQNKCSGYRKKLNDEERNYRSETYLLFKKLNKRGTDGN